MFTRPLISPDLTIFSGRWGAPVPLGEYHVLERGGTHSRSKGIPRLLTQDDVYDGYLLPGGSSVFFNVWWVILHLAADVLSSSQRLHRAMSRNEEVYPDPEVFDPDRFLHPSSQRVHEHMEAVWGFGRRICPGRTFAEASLWLCMANFITTMDIEKVIDGDGNPITPAAAFGFGAIR